jgi:hypothetical protein
MEINFPNITYLVVSGGIIWSWMLQHVSRTKRTAKILSLPKDRQEKDLKSLMKLIKLYKILIFLWPLNSIILWIAFQTSSNPTTASHFYPTMSLMVLFYAYFVQAYFFNKKLFATISQAILQNNP